jgi:hypothetical protein
MTGRWKGGKSKTTLSPPSHRPLEISLNMVRFPHSHSTAAGNPLFSSITGRVTLNRAKSVNHVPGLKCQLCPRLHMARDKRHPNLPRFATTPRGIRPDDTGRMGQEAQFRGCSLFSSPQDVLQFPTSLTFHYSANRPTLGRSEHQASRPAQ